MTPVVNLTLVSCFLILIQLSQPASCSEGNSEDESPEEEDMENMRLEMALFPGGVKGYRAAMKARRQLTKERSNLNSFKGSQLGTKTGDPGTAGLSFNARYLGEEKMGDPGTAGLSFNSRYPGEDVETPPRDARSGPFDLFRTSSSASRLEQEMLDYLKDYPEENIRLDMALHKGGVEGYRAKQMRQLFRAKEKKYFKGFEGEEWRKYANERKRMSSKIRRSDKHINPDLAPMEAFLGRQRSQV